MPGVSLSPDFEAGTDWIGGGSELDQGPAHLYWDTATGGEGLFLGGTQAVEHNVNENKGDLMEAQKGTVAANRIITGQQVQLTFDLTRGTLERWAALVQGFELNMSNGDIVGYKYKRKLGEKDSDIWKQMTIIKVEGAGESTADLKIIDLFRVAPMTEASLTFDAETQRVTNFTMNAYGKDIGGENLWFAAGTYQ